ncbi:uncharacterized protein FIBRA_09395 [Fibroporia radiculosa]|uniref:Uncharacterized protein n=1 Tax=Fibroporia radiculosa TaxID=599839 RepID=J7SCD1_9APHY|nr:uncharacterized protein FIBRA_09395 [Fibroporia radiculosa]CCM07071.1 predicted protein [Fibroporia radiculosa]
MASTTVLITLLIISWFLITLLVLLFIFTVFLLKETYTIRFHLDHNPTPVSTTPNSLPPPLLTYSVVNQVALPTAITLAIVHDHPHLLRLALLGFFLTTLLSVLALALIVPLTLGLTIRHLKREHQWVYNIAATAQCPLPHTTTPLPVIAANCNSNNPTQDVGPLERVLPHFPGAYVHSVIQPPMGVPINGNPVFGLWRVSVTTADALHTAEPVGNWNSLDLDWEEDTWEYLLTRDDNLLESLWASLQDIQDPGMINEVNCFRAIDAKINLFLAA